MNKNTLIALLIIFICFGAAIFMYFSGESSNRVIYNEYASSTGAISEDNKIDLEDMYFPIYLIKEIDDLSLNGEVVEVSGSKKYLNKKFGFSFVVPSEMKISNESSELWKRDGAENFVKHYLGFYVNLDKKIAFNSEIIPYQTLKDWENTDEGKYRLYSDVIAQPEYTNISASEAVIFNSAELNSYKAFVVKSNVLYEIDITGLSKEERENFLNSIEFFAPID